MVKIGTQQKMRTGGKSYVQESSAPSDKIYQVICLPWASVFPPVKWVNLTDMDNYNTITPGIDGRQATCGWGSPFERQCPKAWPLPSLFACC